MKLCFRSFFRFIHRIGNRIHVYLNRIKLWLHGVEYGSNCVIHGKLYIKLHNSAHVSIGKNLYMSSGRCVNALCANKRGSIYATENAIITIGDDVGMSSTVIWCHNSIKIGNNVKIGGNSILMDTDAHNTNYIFRRQTTTDCGKELPILIEDDVLIGMNTIILKGVTIGARSIIGAGSVVTRSIPPDCIACGNPARVVKHLNTVVSS